MEQSNIKQLRSAISEYAKPSTSKAVILFMVDISIYFLAIAGILFFESMSIKILCSVLAGLKISSLFVIAHDAAHDSYTDNKLLNKVIARTCFLPALHNYSLWCIAHNRTHHQVTNIQGKNSWSPLSKDEYDNLSSWGKMLERFYRTPVGICFNYLVERWWKDKLFPYKRLVKNNKTVCWFDFSLVTLYAVFFLGFLVFMGKEYASMEPAAVLMLGFVIPFMIWNFIVGFTVYQQHTHETIPWFKSEIEKQMSGYGEEDVTMHVQYPAWYNYASHNIMEHTAHHVDPRVPLYNLTKAQKIIASILGDDLVTTKFSFTHFLETMSLCKLYDYDNHCWLNFSGNITSQVHLTDEELKYADAA